MSYVTGKTIRTLREKGKLTQKQLAEKLMVSDKTISKWETDKGLPDIGILQELATALGISVAELLTGDVAENQNRSANMMRSKFYVCPVCGNVIHAMGEAAFSCCGVDLHALEIEEMDEQHEIEIKKIDHEIYIELKHPMDKNHYISFIAYLTNNQIYLEKLYPEQEASARFPLKKHAKILVYCNRHGLFQQSL